MYKLELTRLQQDIMRLLFIRAGTSLNQRRIASLLGVSPPAVMKTLHYLIKKDFVNLTKDKESKQLSIKLNAENQYIFQLKRVDNLKQLYDSGFVNYMQEKYPGDTIILFGSYSRGEDTISSDIDIAIIGEEKKADLTNFEKILERKILIGFYKSWEKIDKHLRNNILNGIILAGGVEL